MKPVPFGLAGLGGYAGIICRLLLDQSALDDPSVRFAAVCDPDLNAHADLVAELRAKGVAVVADWSSLLTQPIEAVWLPLPIPLHRPFTEQALEAGKAVMCEKPAAGCVQDLDAMRVARDRAGLPVAIGFQDIYKPSTMLLKRALLGGRIGTVRSATLTACWPRDSRYYARSAWAGRQKMDGVWVMDSPASNALAHFINLALFLLGEPDKSAEATKVEAELYRVNPIENYDTCALRVHTESDARLLVLFTHAAQETRHPRLVIHGERGKIVYDAGQDAVIESESGTETISLRDEPHGGMVQCFANLVRGVPDDRAVATLEIARAHLAVVNGASEATPVIDVPADFIEVLPSGDGGRLSAITGIEDLFDICATEQLMPYETGRAGWTAPAGSRELGYYISFNGPLAI